jgi:hypothetical protein
MLSEPARWSYAGAAPDSTRRSTIAIRSPAVRTPTPLNFDPVVAASVIARPVGRC